MNKEFGEKEMNKITDELELSGMNLVNEYNNKYIYSINQDKSCSICNTQGYFEMIVEVYKDKELVCVEIYDKPGGSYEGNISNDFEYDKPTKDNITNLVSVFKEYVEIKVCKCSFCFDESGVRIDDQV